MLGNNDFFVRYLFNNILKIYRKNAWHHQTAKWTEINQYSCRINQDVNQIVEEKRQLVAAIPSWKILAPLRKSYNDYETIMFKEIIGWREIYNSTKVEIILILLFKNVKKWIFWILREKLHGKLIKRFWHELHEWFSLFMSKIDSFSHCTWHQPNVYSQTKRSSHS